MKIMSTAFRVGIFVVMALSFFAVGVFLIGDKDFLFSPTYKLKADFQNVEGISNGAEVRLGGIHQGTVKEIDLAGTAGRKCHRRNEYA